jgi:flagellar hook protein FlgE
MSLSSVLNTAHTALSAAEFAFGVVANNMANVQADGFKASRMVFSTGPSWTSSLGSGPSGASGGTNPLQVGTGVQVAGISTNASVDQGLLDMLSYSIMFRVNMRVAETASSMFDELFNLRRR